MYLFLIIMDSKFTSNFDPDRVFHILCNTNGSSGMEKLKEGGEDSKYMQ